MPRDLQDHYFKKAKREGFLSRAAYKLIEIDDRKRILKPGDRVLDYGAAPGSWLQVAARKVGPRGLVVGVDLKKIEYHFPEPNVHVLEGDICDIEPAALLGDSGVRFNVILSDMAPDTSGDHTMDHHRSVRLCEAVLDRSGWVLRGGGHLVMKVFEGEAYPELLKRTAAMFEHVKGFSPQASRKESREMYITATGFHPAAAKEAAPAPAPPVRKPARGWGR